MTRDSKKELELEIMRKVFSKKAHKKFTPGEQPDYILHGSTDFGVEIVEFYPDETIARLHNKPNYVQEITNKTYIHKDDASKLEVVNAEYQDPKTGKWKKIKTPVVMQENLHVADRLALLVKLIKRKSDNLTLYVNKLPAIDLILQDSRNTLLDGMNNKYVLNMLDDFRLKGIFRNSGFRNIYVILPPSKGVSQYIKLIK